MKKSIISYGKQVLLCLIMVLVIGQGSFAAEKEEADPSPNSNSQQHMSEILDLLSGFSGKKAASKPEQKPQVPIKAVDLKSAIDVLQNKKEREKVIKVLSALMDAKAEAEKKQSLPSHFADFITSLIDTTSELLLGSLKLLAKTPGAAAQLMHSFTEQEYRKYLLDILVAVGLALVAGMGVENLVRLVMAKVRFHRPKDYTVFNLPKHIFRNCIPVILFGVAAYTVVFYSPIASDEALDKSFMLVTVIIMLRTFLMVLKVLFASRHMRASEKNRQSYMSSYQFVIAIIQVLITGIIFAELGVILGADDQIYQVWLKILSFGVTSLLILAIWKVRFWGITKFDFEDENATSLSLVMIRIVQLAGGYWHWFISLALGLAFLLFFIGMTDHSFFVATATVLTFVLTAVLLALRNLLQKLSLWLESKGENEDSRFLLTLSTQPRIALLNFCQFLLHLVFVILLLQTWGADPLGLIADKAVHPYLASTVSIILIIVIIRLLWIWTNYIVTSHVQPKVINGRKIEASLFAKTIAPILQSIGHWVLSITAIILILEEIGIPIMPIIYGISVIGIAISLGAQSLVKDLINGILTLMEGNIAVGEMVIIGPHTGTVESLSLRGVSLRHANGALQTIPFSEVSNIINKSRDYTAITLELPFPYGTEMSKVREVLQGAYNDTVADPSFQRMIIDPVTIVGVDRFTEAGFVVMGSIRIKPDPKNRFLRVYNQKLKGYLEESRITPPSAPTVVINNLRENYADAAMDEKKSPQT